MIKSLLSEGFALKEKGRYKHAIEVFYKALSLDNSSLEILLEIAELYFLLGNEEKSLNYIEQVLDKNPTHIESLELLERIFLNKNALSEAEQTAKNIFCISKDPNDLAKIFRILNLERRFEEIFEYNTSMINHKILYEKSYAKFFLHDYEQAKNFIKEAIKLKSDIKYKLFYAKICYAQGKKDQYVEIIESIPSDDSNAELLNFKGLAEAYQEHYLTAIEYFKSAIKVNKKNDEYYYNLANSYFKLGETALARRNYNIAISIAPEKHNYHFALANLYYSEKHYKRALEELYEDSFESKVLKSIILYDTGYLALAKKEFAELAKIEPENPFIIDYLNKINADLKLN